MKTICLSVSSCHFDGPPRAPRSLLLAVLLLAGLLLAGDATARIFVATNSTWRYFKGTSEASTPTNAWRELAFDDSSWLTGAAPFHFGTNSAGGDDAQSGGTILSDMRSNYTCLFLRQTFVIDDTNSVRGLWCNVRLDDGLGIWINGQSARNPIFLSGLAYTNTATGSREGTSLNRLDISGAIASLRSGTNMLCLQAVNRSLSDDDFRIEAELAETPATLALATNAITVREDATQLVVRVVRMGAQDAGMSVAYATANGRAVAGIDYEAVSGTLFFAKGQYQQTITVRIFNDARLEGTENFQLTLSNPGGGATLGSPSTATVQITELITTQPASLAVLLGSNATFRVTAASTAPLTYQWQLDGRDLVGATNASLLVSNVSLADLGSYTVVVGDAFGETTSQSAWLKLVRWKEMIVFGSSLAMTSATNGRSWVEWLQELLGLSADAIKNYASGGAILLTVHSQIQQYLGAFSPQTNTLLAPFHVYENLPDSLAVEQYVSNYVANISLLANAGGRVFLVSAPAPLNWASTNAEVWALDQFLQTQFDAAVNKVQANFGLTVFRFDFHDLLMRIRTDPTAYGFTNLTDAAKGCAHCDPNQYFWWEANLHPTTTVHQWCAQEIYRCLTPPLVIALKAGGPTGFLELQWCGGSPPFRVQHSEELGGLWQSEELTFQTNSPLAPSANHTFFRILHLGQ